VDFVANTITIQGKADWHTKNYDFRTVGVTRALRDTLEIVHANRDRHQPHVFTYQGEPLTTNVARTLKTIATRAAVHAAYAQAHVRITLGDAGRAAHAHPRAHGSP
jgi:hypothetical protein